MKPKARNEALNRVRRTAGGGKHGWRMQMGQFVLRRPVVLYETVEAIYQHVNGISFTKKKNDFVQKFGQKLNKKERERIERLNGCLSALQEKVCDGLEETPALSYYFQKWDTESKWQNLCLAKLMIFSFLDIRTTDYRESMERTLAAAEKILAAPYVLEDVNSGGISFRQIRPGEQPGELMDQLDQLNIEEQYRWKIYKMLMRFPQAFRELESLLTSVAGRMAAALSSVQPAVDEACDHWEDYFRAHDFPELLERLTNQTQPQDSLDTYVNISLLAGNDMIYTYGTLEGKDFRQVYIGALLNGSLRVDRVEMTDEAVCNLLKIISDRSKFEILRRISRDSSYCQALSREMNLTTATISRHMSLLLDAGLVHARRGEKRIYYDLNREAVTDLCDTVCQMLLQT